MKGSEYFMTEKEIKIFDVNDGNEEVKYRPYEHHAKYYETDQMGIIHHSNYIRFFEEARLYMMKEFGLDYAGLEEMGIIIPVMSVDCKYIKPLHYDEQIDIYTKITKLLYEKKKHINCLILCCYAYIPWHLGFATDGW